MQIGFVGLGRMGGNMAKRILRDSDHEVVGIRPRPGPGEGAEGHGGKGAPSLEDLVRSSTSRATSG